MVNCVMEDLEDSIFRERCWVFVGSPSWAGKWCVVSLGVVQSLPLDKNTLYEYGVCEISPSGIGIGLLEEVPHALDVSWIIVLRDS